jgi:hypothetical protein
MRIEEIIDNIFNMLPNEGYEYIDANVDKTSKFTVKANGRTLKFMGLERHKNTYRIDMQRADTHQRFLITSFKFAKRIRRKTWTEFRLHKKLKLTL